MDGRLKRKQELRLGAAILAKQIDPASPDYRRGRNGRKASPYAAMDGRPKRKQELQLGAAILAKQVDPASHEGELYAKDVRSYQRTTDEVVLPLRRKAHAH